MPKRKLNLCILYTCIYDPNNHEKNVYVDDNIGDMS